MATFGRQNISLQDLSLLVERATCELPTKTRSDIEHHEQWYTKYSNLLSSKRKAIAAWKLQKQVIVHIYFTYCRCSCSAMQYDKSKLIHSEALLDDEDLVGTRRRDKRHEQFTKEREERFAKLLVWKVR